MECNKDEAIRSRDIAEEKFLLHDLVGAKKFAVKAEHLFPGLEGLPQLLAVLDVHIVAQDKVDGMEPDWYSILQTHAAADEATLRKQYRKLALNLHPDKNKAVGAEGAFMLISEAWSILSDKAKKSAHDARRKYNGTTNFTDFSTQKWSQQNSGKNAHQLWSKCPSCQIEVQCSRAQGSMVDCAVCHHTFVDIGAYRTNKDPFFQGREYSESRDNTNLSNLEEQIHESMKGSTSSHVPAGSWTYGFTTSSCAPEDSLKGAFTSSHMHEKNVGHDKKVDAGVAEGVSQQQSDHQADVMSAALQDQMRPDVSSSCCAHTRTTNIHTNFQCFLGRHRNRMPSGHSPGVVKATSEMVQNVYETVRRERVRAQRESHEKAMKGRIEVEKELRRQELRGRRERKQRKKEEDLKKQAKTALHAKKAFDKLFAREQRILRDDSNFVTKANFGSKIDTQCADNRNTNHEVHQC